MQAGGFVLLVASGSEKTPGRLQLEETIGIDVLDFSCSESILLVGELNLFFVQLIADVLEGDQYKVRPV